MKTATKKTIQMSMAALIAIAPLSTAATAYAAPSSPPNAGAEALKELPYAGDETAELATFIASQGYDPNHDPEDGEYWQNLWSEQDKAYASPNKALSPGLENSQKWVKNVLAPWSETGPTPEMADFYRSKIAASPADSALLRMSHVATAYAQRETPYAWGGGTPNGPSVGSFALRETDADAMRNKDWTKLGFDCARFINHLIYVGTGEVTPAGTENLLNHLLNTGNRNIGNNPQDARFGDIIFYGAPTFHVGMVTDRDRVMDPKTRQAKVTIVEAAPAKRGNKIAQNPVPNDQITQIIRLTNLGDIKYLHPS